jgi:hypothetical protein
MKFATLITSFAIYGTISGNSIYTGDQSEVNQSSYSYPRYDIHQYVNAEEIYNKVQEAAKLPKDQFVKKVNDSLDRIQKVLDFSYDFSQKLENLSNEQKRELDIWWAQIAPKYQQPLPTDPEQLKQFVVPDLKEFVRIVYKADPNQVIGNYKKLLNN